MTTTWLIGWSLYFLVQAPLNIVSSDLFSGNILLDEKGQMFPKGFHPNFQSFEADFSWVADPKRRRGARGIKYMIIDFGLSTQFASFQERENVVGCMAQDATIPELSDDLPYDPFAVDVYTLGDVYKTDFLRVRVECRLQDAKMADPVE